MNEEPDYINISKRPVALPLLLLVNHLVREATDWQRLRARFRPVKLGDFQPRGYAGADTFYLFLCDKCRRFSADIVHGEHRLHCHLCN